MFNKMQKFMIGRYGVDELYKFLSKLLILVIIVNIFLRLWYLYLISLLILIIMYYRVFSKKIYKRSNENVNYLKIKNKMKRPFINIKNRMKEDYIYKKCRKCKKVLKLPLPSSRGIKHVKCPNCKKRLRVFVFRKQKIEIIRKKRV